MNRIHRIAMALAVLSAIPALAITPNRALDNEGYVTLQDVRFQIPAGWSMHQDALSQGTVVMGFHRNEDYVNLYVTSDASADIKGMFGHDAKILSENTEAIGPLSWKTLVTSRALSARDTNFVKGFWATFHGNTYYGYAKATSESEATRIVSEFLNGMVVKLHYDGVGRSLTGADYTGKKYYLGWGAAGMGDPSMMQNEVKYDVLHTHDIFTKDIGGNYIGNKLIGPSTNSSQIKAEWKRIGDLMTTDDMYVQYSSGHGSQSGLGVGVKYTEMRDAALNFKAKEIIIFTMACYSGNLVEAFNAKKDIWSNWPTQGRTLFVMASSPKNETSSTGPGTDTDESGGPNGSAGSAYGHALWKALIGYADGYVDGVKDGYLSLGEIRDFTMWKTNEVGGHKPVSTGAFTPSLIMNRKPSRELLQSLEGGSESLSDAEVMERIQALDRAMRVSSR